MKNNANPIEAYSTLYPATYSLSLSGKSIGARFYSAKQQIIHKIAIGHKGKKKNLFS